MPIAILSTRRGHSFSAIQSASVVNIESSSETICCVTMEAGRPERSNPKLHAAVSPTQEQGAEKNMMNRKEKESFFMFARVLMKYLEQKDPMHAKASQGCHS